MSEGGSLIPTKRGPFDFFDKFLNFSLVRIEVEVWHCKIESNRRPAIAISRQRNDSSSEANGFVRVVGDEYDRGSAFTPQLQDELLHPGTRERVERAEGFVH